MQFTYQLENTAPLISVCLSLCLCLSLSPLSFRPPYHPPPSLSLFRVFSLCPSSTPSVPPLSSLPNPISLNLSLCPPPPPFLYRPLPIPPFSLSLSLSLCLSVCLSLPPPPPPPSLSALLSSLSPFYPSLSSLPHPSSQQTGVLLHLLQLIICFRRSICLW